MYKFCIFDTMGNYREFTVTDYNFAIARIEHYKNWKYYKFATLSCFDKNCWIELQQFD